MNLSPCQISMLALGGLLAASIFWPNIKQVISGLKPVKKHDHKEASYLVGIVSCWEHLKESCEQEGLDDASKELDKIFPMFVKKKREVTNV